MRIAGTVFAGAALVAALVACAPREEATSPRARRAAAEAAAYAAALPFIENDYYYGILLGFGDKCECLEPLSIRAEMKRRIQNIAAIYEQ